MDSCVACSNSSQLNVDRIITYHPFPKELKRKKSWLKTLQLDDCADWHRVCSDHFVPKDFRPGGRYLYPFVVPKFSLPARTDTSDANNTTQSSSDPSPQNNSLQGASLQDPAQQDSTQQNLMLEPVNSDNLNKSITFEDGAVIPSSPSSHKDPAQQGSTELDLMLEPVNSDNVDKSITFEDGTVIPSSPSSHKYPAQQGSTEQDLMLEPVNSDNVNKSITFEDTTVIPSSSSSHEDPEPQGSTQQDLMLEPVNSDNVNKTITFGNDTAIHGSPASALLSPRRSSRKIKPVTLSDNSTYRSNAKEDTGELDLNKKSKETIANGMRCSAWNCPNKYPVPNLSFFGYPSDLATRKVWIKNCGIEHLVGPDENVKSSLKVCGMHFSDEMYLNKVAKKNRLVPKAVPTIFNNCDTSRLCPADFVAESPDVNNSDNTILNNSFTNKNSSMIKPTSSTNKETIVNHEIPPNLADYPKPELKMIYKSEEPEKTMDVCDVPGCIYSKEGLDEKHSSNTKSRPFACFDPTVENVDKWSSILGLPLTLDSKICERHFRPVDIISHDIYVSNSGLAKVKGLILTAMPVPRVQSKSIKRPRVSSVNEHCLTKKTRKQSKESPKPKSKFGDKPEGENSSIDIVPPTPIQNQTLHFNSEPMESRSNITSYDSTTADPQNILNKILPKILKNSSLSISLQPATSKQSKPVSAPSQSTKNNVVLNNSEPYLGTVIPFTLMTGGDICICVDQNKNKKKQIPATQATEEVQEIEIHDIVKPEPIDSPLVITIDDIDEPIPSLADLKNIYSYVPDSKIMRDFYWQSKDVKLPNDFWKSFYNATGNSMVFIENDEFSDPIKRIYFRNSYVPTIYINNRHYVFKEAVKTKQDLESLLDDINDIEICSGYDGNCDNKCIGYFENTSEAIEVCRNCQMSEKKLRCVGMNLNAKINKIKELEKKIKEQKIRVQNARTFYEKEKRTGHNQVIFL